MKSIIDILNQFQSLLKSLGSPLYNFTQFSNIYILLRAIAQVISEQYSFLNSKLIASSIITAVGSDLDDRASEYNLYRLPGSYSSGYIYCTSSISIIIPINTILSLSNSSYQFQTTTQNYFVFTTGVFIPVQSLALSAGANLNSGTSLYSTLYPTLVATVGNTLDANGNPTGGLLGGINAESDLAFRQRIKGYLNSLNKGTLTSIINILENSTITNYFIQEGYPVTGYFTVFINTSDQSVIDTISSNIQLAKPIGTAFLVQTIGYTYIDLTFNVVVTSLTLASSVSANIQSICYNYASTFSINQSINPINFPILCSTITGVVSINLIDPTAVNIVPTNNSIVSIRNIYINISGS